MPLSGRTRRYADPADPQDRTRICGCDLDDPFSLGRCRSLSKRWLIINAVIIAVALLIVGQLVDNDEPWIALAGFLNLMNVIVFSQSNRTRKQ
jgi:hypothetical protein